MLSLNKFFDNPALNAFTSNAAVDFTLNEAYPALTDTQKSYLFKETGVPMGSLAWAKQVHGADVVIVDDGFLKENKLREADALITDLKNVPVAVRTADCLPVFIFDPVHQAVGIVHAGWKSTHLEIVRETYETMKAKYQTDYEDVLVAFGPSIRSCCYEVNNEFMARFPNAVTARNGKLFMDLIKANRDQLMSLGIERHQIFDCRVCTMCDKSYFSFRRDGEKAGRMVSVMVMRG